MAQRIDERLGARAHAMRTTPPEPERKLWSKLRSSQLTFKFRRQAVIDPYIVDFLCPWNGLVVEVDGDTHDLDRDGERDAALESLGYIVLRFSNADVMTNIDAVVEAIAMRAAPLPERRENPPQPLPWKGGAKK